MEIIKCESYVYRLFLTYAMCSFSVIFGSCDVLDLWLIMIYRCFLLGEKGSLAVEIIM